MESFEELFNRKISEPKLTNVEKMARLMKLSSIYGATFPSPQMMSEGDCDGDCVNCEGMEECYKGGLNGIQRISKK